MTESVNPKTVAGSTKPGIGLVPPIAILAAAKVAFRNKISFPMGPWFSVQIVHELGAAKYGAWNWRETKIPISVYVSAITRHLDAVDRGEYLDPESGQPHFAHVIAGAGIMLDAWDSGSLIDDRKLSQNHFSLDWSLNSEPLESVGDVVNCLIMLIAAFAAGAEVEKSLGEIILIALWGIIFSKES